MARDYFLEAVGAWPLVYKTTDNTNKVTTIDIVIPKLIDGPSYSSISIQKFTSKGTYVITEPAS